MRNTVIAMKGLPGSGKSWAAAGIATEANRLGLTVRVVSADDFFDQPDGTWVFDPRKIAQAHESCKLKLLRAIRDQVDVIVVDNTHVSRWETDVVREIAIMCGYRFRVEAMHTDTLTIRDLQLFAKRNQHGVPAESLAAMAMRWENEE